MTKARTLLIFYGKMMSFFIKFSDIGTTVFSLSLSPCNNLLCGSCEWMKQRRMWREKTKRKAAREIKQSTWGRHASSEALTIIICSSVRYLLIFLSLSLHSILCVACVLMVDSKTLLNFSVVNRFIIFLYAMHAKLNIDTGYPMEIASCPRRSVSMLHFRIHIHEWIADHCPYTYGVYR